MDTMVTTPRRAKRSPDSLRRLLGREVVVPAKTVGLSDAEQSLPGKVVDINQEENSLWCTVSGDKRWYSWHVDEVTPWLVQQATKSAKTSSVPVIPERRVAKQASKQASRDLLQSPSGRPQRPQTAGAKAKPRAPGPEHLWKYCKRCNTWKDRPGDFSKNHRTPDGLQFYCRFCHNRMTKFNQQRRLEDQHIAEKQLHGTKSAKKHAFKAAAAKTSPFAEAPLLPSSSIPSPPFDVIGSRVPRQQRTHATYRKDSDPLPSADRSHTLSPTRSPTRHHANASAAPAESTVGSGNGKSKQGSLESGKQDTQHASSSMARQKPSVGPKARPEAQASVELMLQANAVLEELDRLQAAEAAATAATPSETAAAAAAAAVTTDATVTQTAEPGSPPASSGGTPASPAVTHVRTASPQQQTILSERRRHSTQSMLRREGEAGAGLQQRASSVAAQQDLGSCTSAYSLSHTEDQLRKACQLDTPSTDHKQRDSSSQHQHPKPQLHSPRAEQAAGTSDGDVGMYRQPELGHDSLPAKVVPVTEAASPRAVSASRSQPCSRPRSVSPGEPAHASPMPTAAAAAGTAPDHALSIGQRAGRAEDLGSFTVPRQSWPVPKSAARSLLEQASPELQPAASDPAATTAAHVISGWKLAPRAKSSPPGQSALGVAERSPDVSKGRFDACGFPTGTNLARKASSGAPAGSEPASKKRKGSDSAAVDANTSSVNAGTSLDEHGVIGVAVASSGQLPGTALASYHMPDASQIRKTSLPIEVERRLSVHNPVRDSHHTTSAFLSGSALPTEASPVPVGNPPAAPSAEGTLPFGAAGSLAPSGDVFSAFASLSKSLSPHQLQEFLHSLQTPGHGDLRSQITAELSKHLGRGGAAQASSHSLPLSQEAKPHQYGWATAVESAPQLLAAGSSPTALEAVTRSSVSLFPPSAVTASVPLPKKAVKKKKAGVKAESSNASLAACIESLNGARPHGPSSRPQSASFSSSLPASFSAAGLPAEATAFSAAGLTASIPLPAFGSSSVRVARGPGMAGGIKHSALSLGSLNSFAPDLPASTSGVTTAPGAVNAALELSLLLTTLQSLANLPEEEGQLHNTIASGSRQAQAQLRDWLAQLQQHAALAASEPSAAQQAKEDAAIAGQVRGEMWGNLQGILAMLAGQGCSPHVQDMVHQIAVHFANEQSQSVALERRLTGNIAKEKEAQKRTQQQLQGGIQVLTAVQRVLGAVRMQQQRDTSRGNGGQSEPPTRSTPTSAQRVQEAERAERAAQQAVKALQKKESVWEAELGAAQTNNNQLNKRVSELLQEKTVLEERCKQYVGEKDSLHSRVTGLQTDKEALTEKLSVETADGNWLTDFLNHTAAKNCTLSEENSALKKQLQELQNAASSSAGE